MTARKHLELLLYSFVTWFVFYLFGLPDYYQSWYFWAKAAICVVVTIVYFPATYYTLKNYWSNGEHLVNSLWLTLYLTLPLFVYDYLLLALYKGLGISFVIPYWYLTFFYFSFWVQFPIIGWWLQRTETQQLELDAG
ncbi:MAG: hypothetical protein QNJ46_06505 [Leptolyngbyaceae cyanobacterium MO_188.B28]|nr:hypothetical protein [Leptolyngbyaceae cyanobacterium MO_188.B28]